MAYKIVNMMVAKSKYRIKATYAMKPTTLTIHETGNNATARGEVAYMRGNNNMTSYHVAIDDKEAVQAIPFNRNAWHAGDGLYGAGNRTSISIEICFNKDNGYGGAMSARMLRAIDNAAEYSAYVLHQYGWGTSRLRQHWDWSRKNCPMKIRNQNKWGWFKNKVQANLNSIKGVKSAPAPKASPKPPAKKATPKATGGTYTVRSGDTLWGIATANNITVAQLKSYNGLKSNTIKTGQKLSVVKPKPKKVQSPPNEWYWSGTFTANTTIAVRSGLGLNKPLVDRASWLKSGQWVNFNRLYYRDGHWWIRFKYPTNPSAGWFFMTVGEKQTGVRFSTANKLNRLWGKVTNLNTSESNSGVTDWTRKDGVK